MPGPVAGSCTLQGRPNPTFGRPASISTTQAALGTGPRDLWLSPSELAPACRILLGCEPYAEVPREASIFKIEENGSESCELSTNSSFVLVRVPVRIVGESQKRETTVHYSIGSFYARGSMLPLAADGHTTLRFRIPLELFRPREPFRVEFLAGSSQRPRGGPLDQALGGRLARQGPGVRPDS